MKKVTLSAFIIFLIFIPGFSEPSGSIRQFLDNKPVHSRYEIDNEYIISGNVLQLFYDTRGYAPAWFNQETFSNNGYAMISYIRMADRQGLQPTDYHLCLIEKYFVRLDSVTPADSAVKAKLDILLTDAFLLMGSHLYFGKVDPEKEGASWKMHRKDPVLRLDLKLEEAIASNNVVGALDMLAPQYRSYRMMKEELAFFLDLNCQLWPAILSKVSLKPGESSPLIPRIRERLIKLRYKLNDSISEIFDGDLEREMKRFQNDWGLNNDGVIGKSTLEDLNSLPCKLISQLKVNMERFRWLPLKMTEKYIIVNIANFKLDLIAGKDTLISMRAIVGKEQRETPVISELLSYIVFCPTWTVPQTILHEDVVPELLKGPEYLKKKNMKLLKPDGSELGYNDIDWSRITKNHFPYIVRQDPGSRNALGRVKFMFPNSYDIYIHDTPSRGPFARDDRALSSGCVRVEKPYDLAVLLLSDSPGWSPANIRSAMEQDKEQLVRLKIPVDVVLIYLTAWTDGMDRVQFRKDVYQRDEIVLEALDHKPEAFSDNTILW